MKKDFYMLIAEGKALRRPENGYKFQESYEVYCEAEKVADLNNLDHLADLFFAFDSCLIDGDAQSEKYLLMLGDAGNIFAQNSLMLRYLHGMNGVQKDDSKFLYWCDRAIEGGSQLAKSEKIKFLRKNKKPKSTA